MSAIAQRGASLRAGRSALVVRASSENPAMQRPGGASRVAIAEVPGNSNGVISAADVSRPGGASRGDVFDAPKASDASVNPSSVSRPGGGALRMSFGGAGGSGSVSGGGGGGGGRGGGGNGGSSSGNSGLPDFVAWGLVYLAGCGLALALNAASKKPAAVAAAKKPCCCGPKAPAKAA